MKNIKANHLYDEKLPLRVDKALAWLTNSRNKWKEKCIEAKLRLKRQTFAVKRLQYSREDWKLSNARLKYELSESKEKLTFLQRRINDLELQIKDQNKEIYAVKKKQ